ncbi:S8 family peptidase [Acholeplasma vituli]|uniref:S8 family peptidase n=1 Tax=Paracholeplasma vituli TaxID=69473 RepID=A0ABT2PY26_9MOLU|nr:S8 family peptidase [Paracholeplasma vituli]MCU0105648.1 S8 family peptidase [Paracholeplasma vituli]
MKKLIMMGLSTLGLLMTIMVVVKTPVVASYEIIRMTNQADEKIVFEGFTLNQSASTEEIEAEVDETANEIVTVAVQFDYELISDARYYINRRTNINYFIAEQRRLSKQYHTAMNTELAAALELEGYQTQYVSTYSPFIEYEFEKEVFVENVDNIVGELVESDVVATAYIQNSLDKEAANINTAMFTTGSYYPVINGEVNGTGVTVGILEDGIVDKKHTNIAGSNISVRDEWWFIENVSSHATQVASVIGANTGIARGAKLLSVELYGGASEEIDWMLDRGVNIINLSYGESAKSVTGTYSSQSAYMDYVVRTNFVTIVAAAGNFGATHGYVGNPGLGYNVITVGATNLTGTYREDYSSYVVLKGPSKPNIVAPSGIKIPGYTSNVTGTSYSAPVVSGSIALLMEEFPEYKLFPEKVIALLSASSKYISGFPNYGSEGYNYEVGSGLFDYKEARENPNYTYSYVNTSGTSGVFKQVYLYVESGKTIKAALSWLLNSTNSTTIKLTDYDLRLFDPSNRLVASANSVHNNVEVVVFNTSTSGLYRLEIMQNGSLANGKDWIGLSYSIR